MTSSQSLQLPRYGMQRLTNLTATRIDINVESGGGSVAGVAVQTTSVRTNGTQHCSGTVDLARPGTEAQRRDRGP